MWPFVTVLDVAGSCAELAAAVYWLVVCERCSLALSWRVESGSWSHSWVVCWGVSMALLLGRKEGWSVSTCSHMQLLFNRDEVPITFNLIPHRQLESIGGGVENYPLTVSTS